MVKALQHSLRDRYRRLRRHPPAGLYQLDHLYHEFQFRRQARLGPPLVIYQMGKVGSSTVTESLKALDLKCPIYQVHFLRPETIERFDNGRARIWAVKNLRRELDNGPKEKWKLITLTREPIGRNISGFFYNLHYHIENFDHRYEAGEITVSELLERFMRDFDHQLVLNWFDSEVNDVFGVNLYDRPFPVEKGWQILETPAADILLLKLEKLNDCAEEAVSTFLDISKFQLVQTNTSEQNTYRNAYRDFVTEAVLPASYVEEMYSSKYARHFYSEEELATLRKKWLKTRLVRSHVGEDGGQAGR